MMTQFDTGLTLAIALAAGVLAQSLARQLRLPGIVLLLAAGAFLGAEGLNWVHPRSLGNALFDLVDFGVAIILFEGGLNLEWSRLRRQEAAIRRLITGGALVTLIGATVSARVALAWSWDLALLFGSLVVVTGPTVVAPLLREMRLRPRLKTVLEAEGVLIDPIGALLAAFVLHVVATPAVDTLAHAAQQVAVGVGFGLTFGAAAGFLLVGALRYRFVIAGGYENIFTLVAVVLLFEACDSVVAHSGLFAVTVAGVVVGNLETRVDRDLREFKDRLTVLLVGLLFVLLAADVALADVRSLGSGGVVVVAALVLIIRPVSVWISTRRTPLTAQERVFIGAIAPRGIVAAAVASITAATLEREGLAGGEALRALVFLTIAGTVLFSGATARPLAWLLDLRLPKRDRVAILGARGLALALADQLRRAGQSIVFLEPDPKRSQVAEEAGFPVVFGDPLEERTMLRAQAELVGTAIGLTFNEHYNALFVRQALDDFGVPQGFVARESLFGETPTGSSPHSIDVLFDGPHDHERWDVRWRHRQTIIESFEYRAVAVISASSADNDTPVHPFPKHGELFVIVSVRRGKRVTPMHVGYKWRNGDLATIAVYAPERDEALRLLAERGWLPTSAGTDDESRPPTEGKTKAPPRAAGDEPDHHRA